MFTLLFFFGQCFDMSMASRSHIEHIVPRNKQLFKSEAEDCGEVWQLVRSIDFGSWMKVESTENPKFYGPSNSANYHQKIHLSNSKAGPESLIESKPKGGIDL